MNKKAETIRDRRNSRDEQERLLDTALHKMNDGVHMFVGELLHGPASSTRWSCAAGAARCC